MPASFVDYPRPSIINAHTKRFEQSKFHITSTEQRQKWLFSKLSLVKRRSSYVAAKATYIRLLHGKIGFLGFFSAIAP